MAYIRQIDFEEAHGAGKRVFEAAASRAGKVANIIRVQGLDGPSAETSMQHYVSVMKRENALSPPRKEMLATVVSYINDCYY